MWIGHIYVNFECINCRICHTGSYRRSAILCGKYERLYYCAMLLAKVQEVFFRLGHQDVVSWNVLLASHAEYKNGKEVLKLLKDMHGVGVSSDGSPLFAT